MITQSHAWKKIASLFTAEGREVFRQAWNEAAALEKEKAAAKQPQSTFDEDKDTHEWAFGDPLDPYGTLMNPWTDKNY